MKGRRAANDPAPAVSASPSENASVSRRRFMRLLAAGTAAALASPRMSAAGTEAKKPVAGAKPRGAAPDTGRMTRARSGEPGTRPALPEEIEKQKKSLADSLKTIRDYSLPPGSPASFVFRPLQARRAPRQGR